MAGTRLLILCTFVLELIILGWIALITSRSSTTTNDPTLLLRFRQFLWTSISSSTYSSSILGNPPTHDFSTSLEAVRNRVMEEIQYKVTFVVSEWTVHGNGERNHTADLNHCSSDSSSDRNDKVECDGDSFTSLIMESLSQRQQENDYKYSYNVLPSEHYALASSGSCDEIDSRFEELSSRKELHQSLSGTFQKNGPFQYRIAFVWGCSHRTIPQGFFAQVELDDVGNILLRLPSKNQQNRSILRNLLQKHYLTDWIHQTIFNHDDHRSTTSSLSWIQSTTSLRLRMVLIGDLLRIPSSVHPSSSSITYTYESKESYHTLVQHYFDTVDRTLLPMIQRTIGALFHDNEDDDKNRNDVAIQYHILPYTLPFLLPSSETQRVLQHDSSDPSLHYLYYPLDTATLYRQMFQDTDNLLLLSPKLNLLEKDIQVWSMITYLPPTSWTPLLFHDTQRKTISSAFVSETHHLVLTAVNSIQSSTLNPQNDAEHIGSISTGTGTDKPLQHEHQYMDHSNIFADESFSYMAALIRQKLGLESETLLSHNLTIASMEDDRNTILRIHFQVLPIKGGVAQWEMDHVLRSSLKLKLGETVRLLNITVTLLRERPDIMIPGKISTMIQTCMNDIGLAIDFVESNHIHKAVGAANQALRMANALLSDASLIELPYYPFSHYFAVFGSFWCPLFTASVISLAREWKRYRELLLKKRSMKGF